MPKLNILVAGKTREVVQYIKRVIGEHEGYETDLKLMTNGHTDPLHGVEILPDVLVLQYVKGDAELRHLATNKTTPRVPLIVFGPPNDADAIRLAMQAGARDYLPQPVLPTEINRIISEISAETATGGSRKIGDLHVFVNGKGGSGSSFLAANVAHGLASSNHSVTLVDLDLQFAGLCRYLDLEPKRGLFEALQSIEDMDEVSARAFTCEHKSGLRLLSPKSASLRLNAEISPERMSTLLNIYRTFSEFVIADLPRHIDLLSAAVLESAGRIMVVTQQTLPHIHDTARLLRILRKEICIDESKITVVVNRHLKDSAVEIGDIRKALRVQDLVTIPNQYELTTESINSGLPLSEVSGSTTVTKSLRQLHNIIGGTIEPEQEGFLRRTLPNLWGT
ncbi:putative Type II/IV secretion system ATPase TadZ/CpaE, associated with Flp pilus assembly [uncultured Woeseiaceae bacterium]|uniref:Putative Type II/IV secretion system ATPase TadZ/CpaE, associated with Flp pilus assembly n=1 Tax=uncultured Woeseiaceae bacterium TaxID=1983305 RepID=A0A7D9H6I9_9GAMM|nr:putative Type II/IV secretion system ATPase TadZ/CpaE, associated with Flp pilus assembly [uncultured Woeseiaceae bacterium]